MMTKEKRKALVRFVLLYVVSILLIVTIFSAYTNSSTPVIANTSNVSNASNTQPSKDYNKELLRANESLNFYLVQLNKLNEQYLGELKFPISTKVKDSIQNIQRILKDRINEEVSSINKVGRKYDKNIQLKFTNTVSKFEVALKGWENTNNLILATKGVEANPQINLINQLRLKEERIASLENKLRATQANANNVAASATKQQEEIRFLKWAVRSQVITIKTLENKLNDR